MDSFQFAQAEISRKLAQSLSETLTPPRAFPTEMFRFFEQQSQRQAHKPSSLLADVGSYIESKLPVPTFMYLESAVDNDLALDLQQDDQTRRAYTLLTWVS